MFLFLEVSATLKINNLLKLLLVVGIVELQMQYPVERYNKCNASKKMFGKYFNMAHYKHTDTILLSKL